MGIELPFIFLCSDIFLAVILASLQLQPQVIPPTPTPRPPSSSSGLNTFGCIVVVAKEAVVDFPGVTLLLH